jgi:hypothetical protein
MQILPEKKQEKRQILQAKNDLKIDLPEKQNIL